MLVIVGASLVFATVIVNESVTVVVPSPTVMTTLLSPTLALSGVPDRTPVVASKVSQLGTVVPVIVRVSPTSTSDAVTVYVYAESSVAEVTAVLVIVGASLVLATTNVKLCVVDALFVSVAVITTEWLPTSALVGVPARTPVAAVKLSLIHI